MFQVIGISIDLYLKLGFRRWSGLFHNCLFLLKDRYRYIIHSHLTLWEFIDPVSLEIYLLRWISIVQWWSDYGTNLIFLRPILWYYGIVFILQGPNLNNSIDLIDLLLIYLPFRYILQFLLESGLILGISLRKYLQLLASRLEFQG